MALFKDSELNPYQPPATLNSYADSEGVDASMFIPSWARVIFNSAVVSCLLGVVAFTAVLLTRGLGLATLLILMPLAFSWHFCRTYRLRYHNVPKFGWLPWAFVLTSVWLFVVVGLLSMGSIQALEFLPGVQIRSSKYVVDALAGSLINGIACLAMDFVTTFYIPRPSNWKKLLFVPMVISMASFLPSLAVVFLWKSVLLKEIPTLRPFLVLNGLIAGCALTVATCYALIQTHPVIRERILTARSDPRQFTRTEFRL